MEFRMHAIILKIIESLQANGSWTGKTHIQKSIFLFQETTPVDKLFTFVLYKHGPYSFEIEDELEQMKSYAAISIKAVGQVGVELKPSVNAAYVEDHAALSSTERQNIEKIGEFVGAKNVMELERIATTVWVRSREGLTDSTAVAARVHALKPHVSISDALTADKEALGCLR